MPASFLIGILVVILLTIFLNFGHGETKVHAQSSDSEPDPTRTPQISFSSPAPAEQTLGWSWFDGVPEYSYVYDIAGNLINGAATYVGYYRNAADGLPSVNSVYYLHVVTTGLGIPSGLGMQWTYVSFKLPPNTNLAISQSYPLNCYVRPPGSTVSQFTDGCPQSLSAGIVGGTYVIPSTDSASNYQWPTPMGGAWEFQIPVITSTILNNATFMGYFNITDGWDNPWLYPTVGISVWPLESPGFFDKISPSNGATGLSTSPTLNWSISSKATSYEYCYDTTNDNFCSSWMSNGTSTSKSLSGLSAPTTYYWHVRALNANGMTYSNGNSTAFWSFTTANNPSVYKLYLPLVLSNQVFYPRAGSWHGTTSQGQPVEFQIIRHSPYFQIPAGSLKIKVVFSGTIYTIIYPNTYTISSSHLYIRAGNAEFEGDFTSFTTAIGTIKYLGNSVTWNAHYNP